MSKKPSTFLLTALVAGLLLAAPAARADLVPQSEQVEHTDPLPKRLVGVDVKEHLAAPAPVDLGFSDEDGHPVMVHDFFDGFASGARANVHVKVLYGRSSHHHIEAVFKAFARALRVACAKDARLAKMLPSTKGLL